MPLDPALRRGRWISESEASLVYRAGVRTARAVQRNPVPRNKNKKVKLRVVKTSDLDFLPNTRVHTKGCTTKHTHARTTHTQKRAHSQTQVYMELNCLRFVQKCFLEVSVGRGLGTCTEVWALHASRCGDSSKHRRYSVMLFTETQ